MLVLLGGGRPSPEEQEALRGVDYVQLTDASEDHLVAAYSGALALVYVGPHVGSEARCTGAQHHFFGDRGCCIDWLGPCVADECRRGLWPAARGSHGMRLPGDRITHPCPRRGETSSVVDV